MVGHMLSPSALGTTLVRMVGAGALRVSCSTFDQMRSAWSNDMDERVYEIPSTM